MSRYAVNCPACGAVMSGTEVPLRTSQFHCSACGQGLKFAAPHYGLWYILGLLASLLASMALGLRGLHLFLVVCLGFVPVTFLLIFVAGLIWVPKAVVRAPEETTRNAK